MDTIQKTTNKILIKELPSMRVASYRIISANPERDAVNYMKNLLKDRKLNLNNLKRFGIDIPVSETQQNIGLRGYEYWICLPDDIKKLEGATIKNIPISNYAVLRIKNPFERSFDTISNGWLELHDWIKTTGFKTALDNPNRYMLEELIIIEGETYIDLFYPVCIYEHSI